MKTATPKPTQRTVIERLAGAAGPLTGMRFSMEEQAILGALRATGLAQCDEAARDGPAWSLTDAGKRAVRGRSGPG